MVVKSKAIDLSDLDLGYLGFFLGLRMNEILIERAENAGFTGLRQSHGYVIQHLIEADRSISELAARMEVTQQAASKVVAELHRLGVLDIVAGPDRRTKHIRLSAQGWNIVRVNRRFRKQLEQRLIRAVGEVRYNQAKATLALCLKSLRGVERIMSRRIRMPR